MTTPELNIVAAMQLVRLGRNARAKRFIQDLTCAESSATLTIPQREWLWALAVRHRRQLDMADQEMALAHYLASTEWNSLPPLSVEQQAFEKELSHSWASCNDTRLVYADWLCDHGQEDLAAAQRWIVGHNYTTLLGSYRIHQENGISHQGKWTWIWMLCTNRGDGARPHFTGNEEDTASTRRRLEQKIADRLRQMNDLVRSMGIPKPLLQGSNFASTEDSLLRDQALEK